MEARAKANPPIDLLAPLEAGTQSEVAPDPPTHSFHVPASTNTDDEAIDPKTKLRLDTLKELEEFELQQAERRASAKHSGGANIIKNERWGDREQPAINEAQQMPMPPDGAVIPVISWGVSDDFTRDDIRSAADAYEDCIASQMSLAEYPHRMQMAETRDDWARLRMAQLCRCGMRKPDALAKVMQEVEAAPSRPVQTCGLGGFRKISRRAIRTLCSDAWQRGSFCYSHWRGLSLKRCGEG